MAFVNLAPFERAESLHSIAAPAAQRALAAYNALPAKLQKIEEAVKREALPSSERSQRVVAAYGETKATMLEALQGASVEDLGAQLDLAERSLEFSALAADARHLGALHSTATGDQVDSRLRAEESARNLYGAKVARLNPQQIADELTSIVQLAGHTPETGPALARLNAVADRARAMDEHDPEGQALRRAVSLTRSELERNWATLVEARQQIEDARHALRDVEILTSEVSVNFTGKPSANAAYVQWRHKRQAAA